MPQERLQPPDLVRQAGSALPSPDAHGPVSAAPVSDVPVPEPTKPPVHLAFRVETKWKTVEEARDYRAWLEDEAVSRPNRGLSAGERKVLRFLQRDPRTKVPPSDPLEYKRIADARVKRRDKAAKRVEQLARLAKAGSRARARALPRPAEDPAPAPDPSPSAEDPCSQS